MDFNLSKNKIITFFLLLFIVLALPLSWLVQHKTVTPGKKAAGKEIIRVVFDTTSGVKNRGTSFPVTVKLINTSSSDRLIRAAGVDIMFETDVFSVSDVHCGDWPNAADVRVGAGADSNKIHLSCFNPATLGPIVIPASQSKNLGSFTLLVKNDAPLVDSPLIFTRTLVPENSTLTELQDNGTPAVFTISAPFGTNERCRLWVAGGRNHWQGEQITVNVAQNPKYADNAFCYYGSMEVRITAGNQLLCTASGFSKDARTKQCTWSAVNTVPGNYTITSIYGGHSDNCNGCRISPTSGICQGGNCSLAPTGACCDCSNTCSTSFNIVGVLPTPTQPTTNTPTLPSANTPTVPLFTPSPTSPSTPTPTQSSSTCNKKGEGDANCDGVINGVDYSMWLNRQCNSGCAAENLKADFNSDNKVNDDDYSIWFNHRQ